MSGQSNQPAIVLLMNKLQDGRASRSDLYKHVQDAEREYENMCYKLEGVGDIKRIQVIEEMITALRKEQLMSAKNHAFRVQEAIQFYQKALLPKTDEKRIVDSRRSGGHSRQNASHEPVQDYNNYDTNSKRERTYDRQNNSRDDRYSDPRREVSSSKRTPEETYDTRYEKAQYSAEYRQEPTRDRRSSQKSGQLQEEEGVRRRVDQMSDSLEASVRLRKDNPNLTDLSDSLRPTKLAEKYTELYDNDWTDAFEELHNKCRLPEEKVVHCLLTILKEAYKRSCRKANEQINEIEDEVRRLMTRFKINTDDGVSETKHMFRGDIGALRQYRKSLAKLSVPELQQTFASSYLRDILHQYGCHGNLSHTLEYTNKCIELTWLMSVQDPPVVLDMEDHRGFHTEKYKAFTKHGRALDFYVWPALLMHEGGPLLAKGMAQGK